MVLSCTSCAADRVLGLCGCQAHGRVLQEATPQNRKGTGAIKFLRWQVGQEGSSRWTAADSGGQWERSRPRSARCDGMNRFLCYSSRKAEQPVSTRCAEADALHCVLTHLCCWPLDTVKMLDRFGLCRGAV